MRILHEDAHLLVVVKPAGISTQAPPIAGPTLETQVRAHLAADSGDPVFVGTVHRLDRPVSGVVLWAKTTRAARRLSRQFETRQVQKEYWAVATGSLPGPSGLWEDWLIFDDSSGPKRAQVCAAGTPRSQLARTRFEVRAVAGLPAGLIALRLRPETGRTHQLRVQAAARGCPILGDALYGSNAAFEPGIALHAHALSIRHPELGRQLTFTAEQPESWAAAGLPDLGLG